MKLAWASFFITFALCTSANFSYGFVKVSMSLNCPKCGVTLTFLRVRKHFACPKCAAKLKGNTTASTIAALIPWTLAGFVIKPLVYSKFGSDWAGLMLRSCVSGCVSFSILLLLIGTFGTLEIEDEKSAP